MLKTMIFIPDTVSINYFHLIRLLFILQNERGTYTTLAIFFLIATLNNKLFLNFPVHFTKCDTRHSSRNVFNYYSLFQMYRAHQIFISFARKEISITSFPTDLFLSL